MTEYEFTKADGSKRYEICDGILDVHAFMRMHQAVACQPVPRETPKAAMRAFYRDGIACGSRPRHNRR